MKKELNGSEVVSFVKERQAKAVRGLLQEWKIQPKLAIIRTNSDPVVDSYMKIKQQYGEDILIDVDVHTITQDKALETIKRLNDDKSVHGIIVQIPLPDKTQTDEILNSVSAKKDVDGLASDTMYDAPTPVAISWLLAGHNVELRGKKIVVVGHGRLVGIPLVKMWQNSELDVTVIDKSTPQIATKLQGADIIVSATGVPGIIKTNMVKPDVLIVDAGVSSDSNGLIGDVSQDVRDLPKITITPEKRRCRSINNISLV